MSLYDWAILFLGVILECMVLSAMLRGFISRYPFPFALVAFTFAQTVLLYSIRYYGFGYAVYLRLYWICDFAATFLSLMVIIHLIRTAMAGHRHRRVVYLGLLLGAIVTATCSWLLLQRDPRSFTLWLWMTEVGRDYYFVAVLLNAVLWSTLMRMNQTDKRLYLITSGLGLQLAGAAVAHAFRMNGRFMVATDALLRWSYLIGLYVWYYAFKLPEAVPAAAMGRLTPPEGPIAPPSEMKPTSAGAPHF